MTDIQPTRATRSSRSKGQGTEKKKRKPASNSKRKKIFKGIVAGVVLAGVVMVSVLGFSTFLIIKSAPPINPNEIYSLLSENSFLYDEEGNLIENLQSSELRTNVKYSQLPPNLVNAFIAIEDKTFWTHNGFNFIRIFGAIFESVTKGESIRGTSTVTQQLARNLYLAETKDERSLTRKIREAYYSMLLEKNLSKEQIIEAYLNTIFLGNKSYGVQAAAQGYFSKNVQDLTLAECAALAGLPKSPSSYALIKSVPNADVDPTDPNILARGDVYTAVYSDKFLDRQHLILSFMKEYDFISEEEYDEAMSVDMRAAINPPDNIDSGLSSYFTDYVLEDVAAGLSEKLKIDEQKAQNMVYNGGLKIYSTMDIKMQKIVEEEFKKTSNFPNVKSNRNSNGDIIDSQKRILLYKFESYFDQNKNFVLTPDDYQYNGDGDLILLKGKRLNIFKIRDGEKIKDLSVEFKDMYRYEDSVFCTIKGGNILIPAESKKMDKDGNVIISEKFLNENPEFFKKSGNNLLIGESDYTLRASVIQPQAAMVIMDQKNGHIKALVGGRNIEGKMLFSRATNPHQPGSSVKPIAVYGPALNSGWTAAKSIDDAPMNVNGKVWPKNSYSGFKGPITMREAIRSSSNVIAVKAVNELGYDTSIEFLKELGVTTVQESGANNDLNPAALGLGGMTKGISPLEMTGAYASIANAGIYNAPVSYIKVVNKNGDVILESTSDKKQVLDPGNAFILTDMLTNVVTSGTGSRAKIYSNNSTIPVAGKTGTTTNNYDAWFVGYTPYYTSALWIGNDINVQLTSGSGSSAQLWSKIMKQVHEGLSAKKFVKPDNVVSASIDAASGKRPSGLTPKAITEYFIEGTIPTEIDDTHTSVQICSASNYRATPSCPADLVTTKGSSKKGSGTNALTIYFCQIHNPDVTKYPINSDTTLAPQIPPAGGENGTQPLPGGNNNNGNTGNTGGGNTIPPTTPVTPTPPTAPDEIPWPDGV